MNSQIMKQFGLTYQQTKALFLMQYELTHLDIQNETNPETKKAKKHWLNEWENAINNFFGTLDGKEGTPDISDYQWLDEGLVDLREKAGGNKLPLYLILLEASLFSPYFPLGSKSESSSKAGLQEQFKKKIVQIRPLKIQDRTMSKKRLYHYAFMFDIEKDTIDKFIKSYSKAIDGLTGKKMKLIGGALIGIALLAITAGYAAPIVGAAFAPTGLYGAAAISAGLAALGGGAIAAGGMGIAGGLVVVVGGGALLGGGLGVGIGAGVNTIIKTSAKFALTEAAKLEVVMKDILLSQQKDVRFIQEIIREQRLAISSLEDELLKMKIDSKSQKEAIKNLEEAISYLKKALTRSEGLIQGAH